MTKLQIPEYIPFYTPFISLIIFHLEISENISSDIHFISPAIIYLHTPCTRIETLPSASSFSPTITI